MRMAAAPAIPPYEKWWVASDVDSDRLPFQCIPNGQLNQLTS